MAVHKLPERPRSRDTNCPGGVSPDATLSHGHGNRADMSISDIVTILGFSWPLTFMLGLGDLTTWGIIVATGLLVVSATLFYFKFIARSRPHHRRNPPRRYSRSNGWPSQSAVYGESRH